MSEPALEKSFEPKAIEEKWYRRWESNGYFRADASDTRPAYTIVIPPPNVTGTLHMGHALNNTLQDILVRYKRMDGFAALWLPGTDHAGIATQNVVEKELAKEKIKRQDLGREEFVRRVWEWKELSGGKIVHQLRRLGASCDWSRERFTMDEGLSRAVRTVFVQLHRDGLIYRASYLISFCPRCLTALSDLEVVYHDKEGRLTYFNYPLTDGSGQVTVATTRPETMLGDTAVAVHPDDPRYRPFIGKTLKHPFLDREIKIIADEFVDPKFGTGAVKVTPAHDPNDYEMGRKHGLKFITILTEAGQMNENAGSFQGMDRFAARKAVVERLKEAGLYVKEEPHTHAVGHCDRCDTIVEPRVSEQWFVKIAPLAEPAVEAVESGKTQFVPEAWTKTYLHWMNNIRDWCISRQLWWGHRIPVWYCTKCNHQNVAVDAPQVCEKCSHKELRQDPDVLDTWFSSALWPFSTLGWPDATLDLKKFYPTSTLITGFDIIFFWVARMMMMGLRFMKDIPFHTVHIHAIVRDEKGQKMSKSKGNVVDPLEIMDRYGTDAFRFALAAFSVQGRDIALSEKRIEGYRNFMTKVWNGTRFSLSVLADSGDLDASTSEPASLPDRWIRSRLNEVILSVRSALDEYRFSDAADAFYQFFWHEFCDWYLELIKPHFAGDPSKSEVSMTRASLFNVLERTLRLLHPFSPFLTEELWQQLPGKRKAESIMLAQFPVDDGFRHAESLREFATLKSAIETLRNLRSENRIAPKLKLNVWLRFPKSSESEARLLEKYFMYFSSLGGVESLNFTAPPEGPCAVGVSNELELIVPLAGLVDIKAEIARLERDRKKTADEIDTIEKRLANPNFRDHAPAQVLSQSEERRADAKLRLEKIEKAIQALHAQSS